jgi:hypothetical protein
VLRRILFLLAVVALGRTTAFAQEPEFTIHIDVAGTIPDDDANLNVNVFGSIPDNETWLELRTQNFLVAGTASEKDLRKIAADLELLRWMYASDFPRAHSVSSVATTVIVFRNGDSYRPYRPLDSGKPLDEKGYFWSGEDKNYIVLNADDGIPRNVARGYIRSLMPDSASPVPLWFRDGVADYYSTLHVNRYFFGKERWTWMGDTPTGYDRAVLSPMSPKNMVSLARLFAVQPSSPEYTDATRQPFNIESWAWISFLFNGRTSGIAPMLRVFNLLADGESLEAGIENVFRMNLANFDANFKAYVRAGHKSEFVFRVGGLSLNPKLDYGTIICFWCGARPGSPKTITIPFRYDETLADVTARSVRKLSEAEGYFYRGDVMLHLHRLPEAGILLARSTNLMPDLARAHAAMGLLRTMQGRFGEAGEPIAHSLELDPDNYLAYYYDAWRIKIESEHGGIPFTDGRLYAMHASLERVVALAPEFVQASEMLAEVNLARGKDLDRSEKLLIDALQRSPGRDSLFFTLGRVAAQAGDAASAGWLLNRVIRSGSADSKMKHDAKELVARLGPAATGGVLALAAPDESKTASNNSSVTVKSGSRIPADLSPGTDAARIQGNTIRGMLTSVNCANGVTLIIQTGDRSVSFYSSNPSRIAFVSHRSSESGAILCGPVSDSGVAVTVTYKKASAVGDILGEPLKVEFDSGN